MSSLPIYSGPWTDWALQEQLVWTVRSSNANIYTNIITFALSTLVLGACWNICAFFLHYSGGGNDAAIKDHGLHRHHRLIWRNATDPFSVVIELISVCTAWARTNIPQHLRNRMTRGWIIRRTIWVMIVPLGLFAGFTAASILVARLALIGGNVLIKAHAVGQCGFARYQDGGVSNQSILSEVLLDYQSTALRDTIAGRAYARSCYSGDFASTVSCSFFVKPNLTYHSYQHDQDYGCPFGDDDTPFDQSPCNASRNNGAYLMYTAMLDSNFDLGINARPENSIQFQKNTTCSVINPLLYNNSTQGYNTSPYNYTYQIYCLGPIHNQDPNAPCGIDTYTFLYNPAETEFDVGYQTRAVVYTANSDINYWLALPVFKHPNADTTLVSMSANSIHYSTPVYDPFFLATSPSVSEPGTGLKEVYMPYYELNIMGCVDQYTICNPRSSRCTPPSGVRDLPRNYASLDLNAHQIATAFRIVVLFSNTNTYSNVDATGDAALKASDKALYEISTGLPEDQWITEVKGWFEIGLAKMQALSVQYVANTDGEGEIGTVKLPDVDPELLQAFLDQCALQKIKSGDGLQNFSRTGVIVVALVGGGLFFIGLAFHPAILPLCRRFIRKYIRPRNSDVMTQHERDYMADSKYHLYFMAVEDRDEPYEYNMRGSCPTFPGNPELPRPGERAPLSPGRPGDQANVYHHRVRTGAANSGPANASGQHNSVPQSGPQGIQMATLAPISGVASASQQALLPAGDPVTGSASTASSHSTQSASAASQQASAVGNNAPPAQTYSGPPSTAPTAAPSNAAPPNAAPSNAVP